MTAPHNTNLNTAQDRDKMSCEEFQALLPELIGTGEDINQHPHIQSCELCRAFLADLEAIAEAARQLFPTEEPPDELWNQIDARIRQEDAGAPKSVDLSLGNPFAAANGEESPA
jgi:hypothetical protein